MPRTPQSLRCWSAYLLAAFACLPGVGWSRQESLLDAHVIVGAEAQLESREAHATAHEQVELVREVRNCIPAVRAAIDAWGDQLKITPTRTLSSDTQVRWVVDVDSPGPGFVVVNYRVFPAKKQAQLEVLYDSASSLSVTDKERVVMRFDLVRLKRSLVKELKCTQ